ncbi:hypothetical protein DSECCO2_473180 [anaerobic digester metagenome]
MVVWHNTLTQDFYGAWRVNEAMAVYNGMPHCRMVSEEEIDHIDMMDEILVGEEAMAEVTIMKPDKQSTLEGIFG